MIILTVNVSPETAIKIAEIIKTDKEASAATDILQNGETISQPQTQPAPVQTVPIQQQVAVQQTPPVQQQQQVPVQQTPLASPPTYSIAQIQQACAPLIDAGKQPDIVNLIKSFGVQALTQIPTERLGEFATALRGLGAQI